MRPIPTLTMCAYLAIAAASAPALAQSNYFIKLGGVDAEAAGDSHQKQIEILSWSWGEAQSGAKGNTGEFEWKVEEGESAPPPPGAAKFGAVAGAHRDASVVGASEKMTVGGGTTESARLPGKRTPPTVTLKRGSSPSAAPAEKRQHGWVTVPQPLDRGAVRIKVKFPWVGCAVGTRYPALTLGGGAERYELTDAIISDCASDSVSLNYAKVKVRGWNPETKEQ